MRSVFAPPEALSPFVAYTAVYRGNAGSGSDAVTYSAADLEQSVVFAPRRPLKRLHSDGRVEALPAATSMGACTIPDAFAFPVNAPVFAVYFHPGCAAAFLGPDAAEFTNIVVDLESMPELGCRRLAARISAAPSDKECVGIIHDWLLSRFPNPDPRRGIVLEALERMKTACRLPQMKGLAGSLGVSERSLRNHFSLHLGLSPQNAFSVIRFKHAYRYFLAGVSQTWSDIALDAGYADQAHMIREFKRFSGTPPTRLRITRW